MKQGYNTNSIGKEHVAEYKPEIVFGNNLQKLIDAMGWTKTKMAAKTGVVTATITNYIQANKIANIIFLANLCAVKDFKEKGIEVTADKLFSSDFDPGRNRKSYASVYESQMSEHQYRDFVGSYYCYLFDQSKPTNDQDEKLFRELRHGVIALYETFDDMSGTIVVRSKATFFKESEKKIASEIKSLLDQIFADNDLEIGERNNRISDVFEQYSGWYAGDLSVSKNHAFISITSEVYNDNALIVLYSPQKKQNSEYIGGLGSIASVSHGRNHMPTAQKIILSKYEIKCSREEIAEYLSMSSAPIKQSEEARALVEICQKLYNPNYGVPIGEKDKLAIIENRLTQMVRNYIEKNICCVGSVSEDEDKIVFKLISSYKNT